MSDKITNFCPKTKNQLAKRKREVSSSDGELSTSSESSNSQSIVSTKVSVNRRKSKNAATATTESQTDRTNADNALIEHYIDKAFVERTEKFQLSYKLQDERDKSDRLANTITDVIDSAQYGLTKASSDLKILELTHRQAMKQALIPDESPEIAVLKAVQFKTSRELKTHVELNLHLRNTIGSILNVCQDTVNSFKHKKYIEAKTSRASIFENSTSVNPKPVSSPSAFKKGCENIRSTRRTTIDIGVYGKFLKANQKKVRFKQSLNNFLAANSVTTNQVPTRSMSAEKIEVDIPVVSENARTIEILGTKFPVTEDELSDLMLANVKKFREIHPADLSLLNISELTSTSDEEMEKTWNNFRQGADKEEDSE